MHPCLRFDHSPLCHPGGYCKQHISMSNYFNQVSLFKGCPPVNVFMWDYFYSSSKQPRNKRPSQDPGTRNYAVSFSNFGTLFLFGWKMQALDDALLTLVSEGKLAFGQRGSLTFSESCPGTEWSCWGQRNVSCNWIPSLSMQCLVTNGCRVYAILMKYCDIRWHCPKSYFRKGNILFQGTTDWKNSMYVCYTDLYSIIQTCNCSLQGNIRKTEVLIRFLMRFAGWIDQRCCSWISEGSWVAEWKYRK